MSMRTGVAGLAGGWRVGVVGALSQEARTPVSANAIEERATSGIFRMSSSRDTSVPSVAAPVLTRFFRFSENRPDRTILKPAHPIERWAPEGRTTLRSGCPRNVLQTL